MSANTVASVLHRPLTLTLFFSQYGDTKREEQATPAELAERIRVTTAREKAKLPWLKLATFGDVRTKDGSLRHDANLQAICGIEADYDAELVTFDTAAERLEKQGLGAILYTSPSHSATRPRWRVLCPLSEPMQPQRRAHMMGRLNGLFGGVFSRESWTLSQGYYFGSVRHNPAHRVALIDGTAIDNHDDLDETFIGRPGSAPGADPTATDTGEARHDAELVRRIVTGAGFHVEMCALAGRYLTRGMTRAAAADVLRGLMLSHPETARDTRWSDRFGTIDNLVTSAADKFRDDTAPGRREVARVLARATRECAAAEDIRAAAYAEGERQGLPPAVVEEIAAWLYRRERARMGGDHA
jgi:hypothetical protein